MSLSYSPFANLTVSQEGRVGYTPIPDFITAGSWLMLTNDDVQSSARPDATRFAPHKRASEPRRVVLLENPHPTLPRFIRVRVGSTKNQGRSRSLPHTPHQHLNQFEKCCCKATNPPTDRYVTIHPHYINSSGCTADTWCCQEPDDAILWKKS